MIQEPIAEKISNMNAHHQKRIAWAETNMSARIPSEYTLPHWLQQAQVMVPGGLLVGEPFQSIPPPRPPVENPLPDQPTTVIPGQPKPPESSTLLTTAPLVINGLLVATVALIMVVRPQMQEIQRSSQQGSQQAREVEETNVQAGDSGEALGVLIVFLMASAIYISPYLRKYVPPIVRLIGGIMIGIIFNLALKYMV